MKQLLPITFLLACTWVACKNAPKADEAKTTAPQAAQPKSTGAEFKADLQKSNVQFTGVTPVVSEHGKFLLKEGTLTVKDSTIQAGYFIIDATSLTATDDDGSANKKLQTHLKSPDFFDVEKFGIASFEITGVQPVTNGKKDLVMKDATHTITGNLKIKEITKNITFPAKISIVTGKIIADANFNIDRTQWGINYGNDKSKGVKYIKPEINLKVHLEANR
jgi:polyisoprenoid-binding protein YceI